MASALVISSGTEVYPWKTDARFCRAPDLAVILRSFVALELSADELCVKHDATFSILVD